MYTLRSFLDAVMVPGVMLPVSLSLRVLLCIVPALAVIGIPLGYYLGRKKGGGAAILDFLVSLPLVFPPIATGFILLVIFGRNGPFGALLKSVSGISLVFSFWGVAFAGFISGLPLMVKTVQAAVRNEIEGYIEAAYMLGKSKRTTFFVLCFPSFAAES